MMDVSSDLVIPKLGAIIGDLNIQVAALTAALESSEARRAEAEEALAAVASMRERDAAQPDSSVVPGDGWGSTGQAAGVRGPE